MRCIDIGLIKHARPWIIKVKRLEIKMKGYEYKKQDHECNMKEINAKRTKAMRRKII
jgi:hypothetical protein